MRLHMGAMINVVSHEYVVERDQCIFTSVQCLTSSVMNMTHNETVALLYGINVLKSSSTTMDVYCCCRQLWISIIITNGHGCLTMFPMCYDAWCS